jgi:hypothetical protein
MTTTVRPESLTLLRAALFQFEPIESGCAVLFRTAPFGGVRPLLHRVAELTGATEMPKTEETLRACARTYLQFLVDMPTLVSRMELSPGRYDVPSVDTAIARITEGRNADDPKDAAEVEQLASAAFASSFADYLVTFDVTDTLLAMARASSYRPDWDFQRLRLDEEAMPATENMLLELHANWIAALPGTVFSVPVQAVDGKRPYGDFTYYYWELEDRRVPGIVADGEMEGGRRKFSSKREQEIDELQQQTPLVFQAIARHGVWR